MVDQPHIQQLLAALDSEDTDTVLTAIHQLGQKQVQQALPKLLHLSQSENARIRTAAQEALLQFDEQLVRQMAEDLDDGALLSDALKLLEDANKKRRRLLEEAGAEDTGASEPEPDAWDLDETLPPPRPIAPPMPAAPAPAMPKPEAPGRGHAYDDEDRRASSSSVEPVQFTAYYPREMRPDDWQPLQAYVFRESAADQVAADAEKQLGILDSFRRILENARRNIGEGETITATPWLPGFQFNPPTVSVGFYEDWHRFEFKLRAKDAPLNIAANGFLTFTAGGVIVADIPLSIFVTPAVAPAPPQPTDPRPLYDTVFASYSHKDTIVVEKVEAAAKAFGMTYLRDVVTLRSGEDWNEGLKTMIDQSTIFQMFWSVHYSQSPHCRAEWEYAVSLGRESQRFIRPVYWLQPMPDPPAPIQHLHFTYQPDLVK